MSDIIIGSYYVVGTLAFVSMWFAAAQLLWHLLLKDLIDEFKED